MDLIGTLNNIEAQLDVLVVAGWSQRTSLAEAAVADAALPVLGRVLEKVKVVDGDILASQRFSTAPYAAGHKSQASYVAVVSGSSVKQAQRRCRVSKSLRTMHHARAALIRARSHFVISMRSSRSRGRCGVKLSLFRMKKRWSQLRLSLG